MGAAAADDHEEEPIEFSVEAKSAGAEPGSAAVFTIKLSDPAKPHTSVRFSTGAADGVDAATAEADYEPKRVVVQIPKGDTSAEVKVEVNDDALDELREKFLVTLTDAAAAGGATIDPDDKSATGWIQDNDDPPAAKVGNAADVTEGNTGAAKALFTVTLSKRSGREVRVAYATVDGTAKAGEDYTAKSGVLKIATGDLTGTVSVDVTGDTKDESNETFTLALTREDETATIAEPNTGTAKIVDDDEAKPEEPTPKLSIFDARVKEGNTGTTEVDLALRLTEKSSQRIVVEAATENGSAVAPADYRAKSSTVVFDAGQTTAVFTVLVNGDTADEPEELFYVNVKVQSGKAQIADGRASVAIADDDDPPSGGGPPPPPPPPPPAVKPALLSISDASADEPTAAPGALTFTVTIAQAVPRAVTVNWATANGTATAGSDYTAAGGTLSFAAGETTKTVAVALLVDTEAESNETFFVNLSGPVGGTLADAQGMATIVEKNAPASLSITDVVARESEGATFTVELTGTATSPVSVTFSTSDGTAREGLDYLGRRATLTFAPGDKTKAIAVTVLDDDLAESVETFSVNLGNPVNAVITKSRGVATIESSDPLAAVARTASVPPTTSLPVAVNPTKTATAAKGAKALIPRMALGPLAVAVDRRGVARMVVACKKISPVTCSGRVALETAAKPKLALAAKSFAVRKGKRAALPLKLSPPALKLLAKRGTLRARVVVFVRVGKAMLRVLPGVITLESGASAANSSAP